MDWKRNMFVLSTKTANGWTEIIEYSKNTSTVWDTQLWSPTLYKSASSWWFCQDTYQQINFEIIMVVLNILPLEGFCEKQIFLWTKNLFVMWTKGWTASLFPHALPTNVLHEFDEINKSSMAAEVLSLKLRQALKELRSILGGLMNCSVDTKTKKQTNKQHPHLPSTPKPWNQYSVLMVKTPAPIYTAICCCQWDTFFIPGHSELMTNLLHTLRRQPALRANPSRLKFLPGCDADWKWVVSQGAGAACWDGRDIKHWWPFIVLLHLQRTLSNGIIYGINYTDDCTLQKK